MFDMGFAEMMIIGIVALLVIGPERLPAVASSAGKWFAKIKNFVANVKSDVEREFKTDELQKMLAKQQDELQSIKEAMINSKDTIDPSASIKNEINKISKDLKS
jgi:sec-independent protein translocase protein TatB